MRTIVVVKNGDLNPIGEVINIKDIEIPSCEVPVLIEFDESKNIGFAKLFKESGQIKATITADCLDKINGHYHSFVYYSCSFKDDKATMKEIGLL